MLPPDGVDAFRGREPEVILLTNRHHYRHSDRFTEEFGCPVLCHQAGLHEFEGGPPVQGFAFGDDVANGVLALEVGALTPEETAFHVDAGSGSAVVRGRTREPLRRRARLRAGQATSATTRRP